MSQTGELAVGVSKLEALVREWRQRCEALADQRKYWEAGRLSEAANDLAAIIRARHADVPTAPAITTDKQVRDAYDRLIQRPGPMVTQPLYDNTIQPPVNWPGIRIAD